MTSICYEMDRSVSTDLEKRKFYRFFTGYQVNVNVHMSLQFLRMGSQLRLYELDEMEWVCWYQWYLHREMDQWRYFLFFLFLFSLVI